MFKYTRVTIEAKTGEVLDQYDSESEFGNSEAFISQLMSVPRQQCCTVQMGGDTMMIVEHHQSTLIKAWNIPG